MTIAVYISGVVGVLVLADAWWRLLSWFCPPDPPPDIEYERAVAEQREFRLSRDRWRRLADRLERQRLRGVKW